MSLHTHAARIDGYLLAVAELKDDGTHFRCVYLGEGAPSDKAWDVAEKFGIEAQSVELSPERATLTSENLPASLEEWLLNRIRPMNAEVPMDRKLTSGLAAELVEIFNRAPAWFRVVRIGSSAPNMHLGAFWAIYVFGLDVGSCAIHCSWDD